MEASTSNAPDDVKTFRGRSLEELLPQIRAELGPDAIVLRRREGRDKKAGGFFQRPFVEVDARAPHADERPLEIRSDRATAEGLSSPAVQALFEQATPFADALAAAARDTRMEDDTFSASFSPDTSGFSALPQEPEQETPRRMRDRSVPEAPSRPAGLYGPQPNVSAIEDAAPKPPAPEPAAAPEPEAVTPPPAPPVVEEPPLAPPPVAEPRAPPPRRATPSRRAAADPSSVADAPDAAPGLDIQPAPVPAARPAGVPRPPSADAAEERLIASGISAALAADVVGEAVVHALPFSAPRNMKRLVRAAFARRIPTPTALGPGPRTIAIVGGGGAGKSSAVAHLAATYAASGAEVAVIELRGNGSLAHRLQPLGVGVISASGRRTGDRTPRRPRTAHHPDRHAGHRPEREGRRRQGARRGPQGAGRRGAHGAAGHDQRRRRGRGRRCARAAEPQPRRPHPHG